MAKSNARLAPVSPSKGLNLSIVDQVKAAEAAAEASPVVHVSAAEIEAAEVIAEAAIKTIRQAAPATSIIRKGKPMPNVGKGKTSAHAWDSLEVGDSFFVPGAKIESFWSMCAERNKRSTEVKFKACRDTEDGVVGVGVWRVS